MTNKAVSPKSQTRNPKQAQMTKSERAARVVRHWSFGFDSDFWFGHSDLRLGALLVIGV
jgi:hypothetical protein